MMSMMSNRALLACLLTMLAAVIASPLSAQDAPSAAIQFTNVHVFDGSSAALSADRLTMALMADGGLLVSERAENGEP